MPPALKPDLFLKNILVVFTGASLANALNLLCQLLIAHRLSALEFASFNSLLAVFSIASAPLLTFQLVAARQCAEYKARGLHQELSAWLSGLFCRHALYALATVMVFWFVSLRALPALGISSAASGLLFAALLATTWIAPVLTGAVQGLERFSWFSAGSVLAGLVKITLAFVLIGLGYSVSGALGAFVASQAGLIVVYVIPLRGLLRPQLRMGTAYRRLLVSLLPFALSSLCFLTLVSADMIMVKLFFSQQDAGYYSVAQMIGKIFLFLPGPVTMVMFPRTSSLNAQELSALPVVRRSLGYVFAVCIVATIVYNSMPGVILKVLTGKAFAESVALGRMFGVSMSVYTLVYVLISYFLSVKNWRFLPWLAAAAVLEVGLLYRYHASLAQVQVVLSAVGSSLLIALALLAFGRGHRP